MRHHVLLFEPSLPCAVLCCAVLYCLCSERCRCLCLCLFLFLFLLGEVLPTLPDSRSSASTM